MNKKLENGRFLKIEKLYAFVSKDKDGNEGVMAMQKPSGVWLPLIGADMKRVDSLKPIADEIAKVSGMDYEIREFFNFDFAQLAELIGEWYVEWKEKITDNKIPHRLGFAKEDLKNRIEQRWKKNV